MALALLRVGDVFPHPAEHLGKVRDFGLAALGLRVPRGWAGLPSSPRLLWAGCMVARTVSHLQGSDKLLGFP